MLFSYSHKQVLSNTGISMDTLERSHWCNTVKPLELGNLSLSASGSGGHYCSFPLYYQVHFVTKAHTQTLTQSLSLSHTPWEDCWLMYLCIFIFLFSRSCMFYTYTYNVISEIRELILEKHNVFGMTVHLDHKSDCSTDGLYKKKGGGYIFFFYYLKSAASVAYRRKIPNLCNFTNTVTMSHHKDFLQRPFGRQGSLRKETPLRNYW